MKRTIILLIAMLPIVAMAQHKNFTSFYNTYSGRDGFTTVEITGEMVKMMGNMMLEQSDDRELLQMLGDIKSIKIVVSERASSAFTSDMNAIVGDSTYKLMTSIVQGGQTTRFYFIGTAEPHGNDSSTNASEFLMLSYGGEQNVVIDITGRIDLQKISKLSNIKIGGMEKLGLGHSLKIK